MSGCAEPDADVVSGVHWRSCGVATERSWRHLEAMPFQTTLTARVPRCSCNRCGGETNSGPWAEKHSRSALLSESFASIDEKSFGAGQDYVTVITGIDQSRVLEVTSNRASDAADPLWITPSDEQRIRIRAIWMNAWQTIEATTERKVPNARFAYERFHIA